MITFISSSIFLFAVVFTAVLVKGSFLASFFSYNSRKANMLHIWAFVMLTIMGSLFSDVAWIIKLSRKIFMPEISYAAITFVIRIAWSFLAIQYQSFSLFIQSITQNKFKLSWFNIVSIGVSSCFSLYFLLLAFLRPNYLNTHEARRIAKIVGGYDEFFVMQLLTIYILFFLILPTLYYAYKSVYNYDLPHIVRQQMRVFILFFITPYLCIETLLAVSFRVADERLYPVVLLSTILFLGALYYCFKKVTQLRFLNKNVRVQSKSNMSVLTNFKTVLEQCNSTQNVHELHYIVQSFFKEAFNVPLKHAHLTIHSFDDKDLIIDPLLISIFNGSDSHVLNILHAEKILVYDEVAFNDFYASSEGNTRIIALMDHINADIFIPIRVKGTITGYIAIDRRARKECYSDSEQDAMIVFSNYISNCVGILQHQGIDRLMHKEKQLKQSIYAKHQEINQYKESIESFLKHTTTPDKGVLFYKSNQFFDGNVAVKSLLSIDLNTDLGHPVSQSIRKVAQYVERYKTPHADFIQNSDTPLLVSAVPHLQDESVIITICHPDVSALVNKQMHQLQNPNDWPYLLYLESTTAGKLISSFLPGSGETLLTIKINLLKAALSGLSLFLDVVPEDLTHIVELLQMVTMRTNIRTFEPTSLTDFDVTMPIIFGANKNIYSEANQGLVEQCDHSGMLFIHNMHYLDMATQKRLALFMQSGMYKAYKGEHEVASSARIVCASPFDLSYLAKENSIDMELYALMKDNTFSIPSLHTIARTELCSLIDGFAQQALKAHAFKKLLILDDASKDRILAISPTSLQELKRKVQQALFKKSKETNVESDSIFDEAYMVSDPSLHYVARLGKKALKDQKMLKLLWNKFKNQNQIAAFLGVNRSSVHRRCKMFNIG